MELSFAFLCDYADQSAKMTAVGIGFDTIYAAKVPASHRLMFAVLGVRFTVVEVGPKQLGVRIIDADGTDIAPPMDTTINVEPPPPGFTHRAVRVALGLQGLTFPRYGDYSVRFLIAKQEVANIPLKVTPPPGQPKTA